MTQIPIPITVEVSAAAATPEVTSAFLYSSLLASVGAMADSELWVLMEAVVYSLRQRDTLTRSLKSAELSNVLAISGRKISISC
jgi:hypothetical protein